MAKQKSGGTTAHGEKRGAHEGVYDERQIGEWMRDLPGWHLEEGSLRRHYTTDGWPTTLMLVNAIAYIAEAANHHPDLSVSWANVRVTLSTHSAGGVTGKDVELARRIEDVVLWRPVGGSLKGTPNAFVRGGEPA